MTTFTNEVLKLVDTHGHIDDIDYICDELLQIACGIYCEIIGIDQCEQHFCARVKELVKHAKDNPQ